MPPDLAPSALARIPDRRRAIGGAALFSGVALLTTIVFQASLPVMLAMFAACATAAALLLVWSGSDAVRSLVITDVTTGAMAGIGATLAYDLAKFVLSVADPSPFNPFDTTRAFGTLLLGTDAPLVAIQVSGTALHLLNGTAFGVAFASLFGRRADLTRRAAIVRGVGWGLFLESFQLTLYPGWLGVTALAEFTSITFLGHVVYGGVLGAMVLGLRRRRAGRPAEHIMEVYT